MFEFQRSRRLLTRGDYQQVFQAAKKVNTPSFTILYRGNALQHARLGLAVSKKMLAKAHDRNRIKRLVRETFRCTTRILHADIVVLVRSGIQNKTNPILMKELTQAWNTLNEK